MIKAWGLSVFCALWASTTLSATFDLVPGEDSEATPNVFALEGEILAGDGQRFVDKILGVDSAVIILVSPGGSIAEAVTIGSAIRMKRFTTLVPDDFECASACGLIWLAGEPRLMGPKARVGFHAAYDENGKEEGAGNAIVGAYLSSLGLSLRAIVYLTDSPPEEMQWLSFAKAAELAINVIQFDAPSSVSPARQEQPVQADQPDDDDTVRVEPQVPPIPDESFLLVQTRAARNLNVRSGPNANFPIVRTINQGESVQLIATGCVVNEVKSSWCRVTYNGILGWVNSSYLIVEEVESLGSAK